MINDLAHCLCGGLKDYPNHEPVLFIPCKSKTEVTEKNLPEGS